MPRRRDDVAARIRTQTLCWPPAHWPPGYFAELFPAPRLQEIAPDGQVLAVHDNDRVLRESARSGLRKRVFDLRLFASPMNAASLSAWVDLLQHLLYSRSTAIHEIHAARDRILATLHAHGTRLLVGWSRHYRRDRHGAHGAHDRTRGASSYATADVTYARLGKLIEFAADRARAARPWLNPPAATPSPTGNPPTPTTTTTSATPPVPPAPPPLTTTTRGETRADPARTTGAANATSRHAWYQALAVLEILNVLFRLDAARLAQAAWQECGGRATDEENRLGAAPHEAEGPAAAARRRGVWSKSLLYRCYLGLRAVNYVPQTVEADFPRYYARTLLVLWEHLPTPAYASRELWAHMSFEAAFDLPGEASGPELSSTHDANDARDATERHVDEIVVRVISPFLDNLYVLCSHLGVAPGTASSRSQLLAALRDFVEPRRLNTIRLCQILEAAETPGLACHVGYMAIRATMEHARHPRGDMNLVALLQLVLPDAVSQVLEAHAAAPAAAGGLRRGVAHAATPDGAHTADGIAHARGMRHTLLRLPKELPSYAWPLPRHLSAEQRAQHLDAIEPPATDPDAVRRLAIKTRKRNALLYAVIVEAYLVFYADEWACVVPALRRLVPVALDRLAAALEHIDTPQAPVKRAWTAASASAVAPASASAPPAGPVAGGAGEAIAAQGPRVHVRLRLLASAIRASLAAATASAPDGPGRVLTQAASRRNTRWADRPDGS